VKLSVPGGDTVIVNVCAVPSQPLRVGVTTTCDEIVAVVVFVATNEGILPAPVAVVKPVLIFVFVQLNVAPVVPEKVTAFVFVNGQSD
jgi:hypothetical protein